MTATYNDALGGQTATSDAVMVILDDRPQAVRDYDTDGTPGISIGELFDAIDAYYAEGLTISELFDVIDAYYAR